MSASQPRKWGRRALFTLTLSFPAILCPHCKNVQYLQLCVLITLKTPMQVKLTKNMVYAIECVFAACCEVSRWRAGGGARRQEATFQSVCSAISTPTPPLIIHKYKIQNSKIQKYKNSKTQKYATLANTQIQCKYVIRHIHIHSKSNAEI